ncbi:MAG: DUF427 domain-containing protein [Kiloniellales bacterium]
MTSVPAHAIRLYRDGRRFRVVFAGKTLADSCEAVLLCEGKLHPVIYFPAEAVDQDLLQATDHRSHCPFKGDARYWSITAGDVTAENAAWSYPDPLAEAAGIAGHIAFYWNAVDSVWHEEQELLAHPRNPFIRIDTLESQRRVDVRAGGEILADSRRTVMLFETGLPTRYYFPRIDVNMSALVPSTTRSVCPYKGTASYFSATLDGKTVADIAWVYEAPFVEVALIKDHICFYPERVDSIEVADRSDGEPL